MSQYVVGSVQTLLPSLPAMHWVLTRLADPPLANIVTKVYVNRLSLVNMSLQIMANCGTGFNH